MVELPNVMWPSAMQDKRQRVKSIEIDLLKFSAEGPQSETLGALNIGKTIIYKQLSWAFSPHHIIITSNILKIANV